MLVTDVGDEIVGGDCEILGTVLAVFVTNPLSFYISVGHQDSKNVTNIGFLSPILKNCHQQKVTNIYVAL